MKEYLENLLGRPISYYQLLNWLALARTQLFGLVNELSSGIVGLESSSFSNKGIGNLSAPLEDGISYFERDFSIEELLLFAYRSVVIVAALKHHWHSH